MYEFVCDNDDREPSDLTARYHDAAKGDDVDTVRALLAAGVSINAWDEMDEVAAVHLAAESSAQRVLRYLMTQPACDFTVTDGYGLRAFELIPEDEPKLRQDVRAHTVVQFIERNIDPEGDTRDNDPFPRHLLSENPDSFDNREAETNAIAGMFHAYNTASSGNQLEEAKALHAAGAPINALDIVYGMATTHLVVAHKAHDVLAFLLSTPDCDFLVRSPNDNALPSYYACDMETFARVAAHEKQQAAVRGLPKPEAVPGPWLTRRLTA